MRTTEQKFQQFEDEIARRPAARSGPAPLWGRLAASAALLVVGFLLYALPGRFPPPAWRALYQIVRGNAVLPLSGLLMTIGQSLSLLVAWILLLYVAVRVAQLYRRDPRWQPVEASQEVHTPVEGNERQPVHGSSGADSGWEYDNNSSLHQQDTSVSHVPDHGDSTYAVRDQESGGKATKGGPLTTFLSDLVTDSSLLTLGRPALPALCTGLTDPAVFGHQLWAEGVGVAVGTCCHPGNGRTREQREDTLLVSSGLRLWPGAMPSLLPVGLFLVADGLGFQREQQTGSTSSIAVGLLGDTLLSTLGAPDPLPHYALEQLMLDGLQQVNARLFQLSVDSHQPVGDEGTTLTAVLLMGMTAYIANVGDNRAYLYRVEEGLMQITSDHAAADGEPGDRATAGNRSSGAGHGQRNRSLGVEREIDATLCAIQLAIGDMLFLCTNGLWSCVDHSLLEQTMQWFARAPLSDPGRLCSILREAALEGGGTDHLSAVVVQVAPLPRDPGQEERAGEGVPLPLLTRV
jgi:PPM family protein phosphatase